MTNTPIQRAEITQVEKATSFGISSQEQNDEGWCFPRECKSGPPAKKKKVQKEDEGQGEPEAKGEEETMDVEVAQPEKWRRKPWSCA